MQKYKSLMRNITGSQITCFWTSTLNNECWQLINTKTDLLIVYVKYSCLMKTKFRWTSPCWKDIEKKVLRFHWFQVYVYIESNYGLYAIFKVMLLLSNAIGFHEAFATDEACKQETLTLPDTKFTLLGTCLCSNGWVQFSRTCRIFPDFFPLLEYLSVLSRFFFAQSA